MKWLKKIGKFFIWLVTGLIGYALLVYCTSLIKVNDVQTGADIDVYILSNGVHTDVVVPVKTDVIDWHAFLDPQLPKVNCTEATYVAFGWGDKGFYLETPTWADLKFSTAFKAAFFLSTSAMHVTYHNQLTEGKLCKHTKITRANYEVMVEHIKKSFVIEKNQPQWLENAHYFDTDVFYAANGTYSIFYTCNSWANQTLKAGQLPACLWTLHDRAILSKY